MQIKSKYSWAKHLDFMVVDLIALFISFIVSYYLKFDRWDFGTNDEWTRYLFIVLILSIVINFFVNPYSGILRRSYYMEIIRAFQLAIYNLLLATAIFIVNKIGYTDNRQNNGENGQKINHMQTKPCFGQALFNCRKKADRYFCKPELLAAA